MNDMFVLPDINFPYNSVDSPPLFTIRNCIIEHVYFDINALIFPANRYLELLSKLKLCM